MLRDSVVSNTPLMREIARIHDAMNILIVYGDEEADRHDRLGCYGAQFGGCRRWSLGLVWGHGRSIDVIAPDHLIPDRDGVHIVRELCR